MVHLVEGEPRDIQLEVELRELRRLSYLRKLLELPASIFSEQAPAGCHGECHEPARIGVLGLTCCHFYEQYRRYNETLRLETLQRQVIEGVRARHRSSREGPPKVEGAPLQEKYHREHTGTARLRRIEVDLRSAGPAPDAGDPQAHLRDTIGNLK